MRGPPGDARARRLPPPAGADRRCVVGAGEASCRARTARALRRRAAGISRVRATRHGGQIGQFEQSGRSLGRSSHSSVGLFVASALLRLSCVPPPSPDGHDLVPGTPSLWAALPPRLLSGSSARATARATARWWCAHGAQQGRGRRVTAPHRSRQQCCTAPLSRQPGSWTRLAPGTPSMLPSSSRSPVAMPTSLPRCASRARSRGGKLGSEGLPGCRVTSWMGRWHHRSRQRQQQQ